MIRGPKPRRRSGLIRPLLLGMALVIALVPIAWTALAAVGIAPDNHTSPPSFVIAPTFDHLADVTTVEPAFWQELATSAGVSIAAAFISGAVAFLAAYAISRSGPAAARRLGPGLLVLATLPVMAYVLPLSELMRRLGWLDSIAGITFAESAATAPLAIYIFSAHLASVSRDGEEAARLDGASIWRVLRAVVLPVAAPVVAATTIVLCVLDWNMLLTPLVLTGINVRTLPVVLTDFFTLEREVDWPTAAAALTISLAPLVLMIGALRRIVERFSLTGPDSADEVA
jgi:ABC-type glycerol-3-phosphate transport system permease component